MICYRDMTFCRGNGCVKFDNCERALTPDVERIAQERNLPIAEYAEPEKVRCYQGPESKSEQPNP